MPCLLTVCLIQLCLVSENAEGCSNPGSIPRKEVASGAMMLCYTLSNYILYYVKDGHLNIMPSDVMA